MIQRVLASGWVGQLKIHGHRAQIHIPSDRDQEPLVYNRQGALHKKLLPQTVVEELRRLFEPETGWNVIDAEWIKDIDKLYVFDFLKKDGELLNKLTFSERYVFLPQDFISPHLQTLPLLKSVERCLEALERKEDFIEGLVFKALNTKGFADTSIVRCRRQKAHQL